jgi:hypothetical protein
MSLPVRKARVLLSTGVLTLLLLGPGCGGGVTDPDPDTGGQPKRSVISEHGWGLEPFDADAVDITLTGAGTGTLDATVEWTFAANDVDLYVTATACTAEMFANDRCAFKAKADSSTTKPERVSFGVSAGDTYRFWIVNYGPQRESGTFVAGLTQ